MDQFDTNFRKLLITGNGVCKVYKNFDMQRLCLGDLKQESVVGIHTVLFDCNPLYTIETMSFCNIGHVSRSHFKDIASDFPDLKIAFQDQVLHNPYDIEREQFIKLTK